jgi:hypothetical protein
MTYLERWIPTFVAGLVLIAWALYLMHAERRDERARQTRSAQGGPNPRS